MKRWIGSDSTRFAIKWGIVIVIGSANDKKLRNAHTEPFIYYLHAFFHYMNVSNVYHNCSVSLTKKKQRNFGFRPSKNMLYNHN